MPKQSAMIINLKRQLEAEYQAKFDRQMNMAMQLICDASFLAANRVLKMGPGRAKEFRDVQEEEIHWIVGLMGEDQEDDPDFEYAKAKVDERLRRICGEAHFQPWEVRYGI